MKPGSSFPRPNALEFLNAGACRRRLTNRPLLAILLLVLFLTAICIFQVPAYAVCAAPSGSEGDLTYNPNWRSLQYCSEGWIAVGKAQYAAPGVIFDGSTSWLRRNTDLSGLPADNTKISGSFWVQRTGNFATVQTIFRANNGTTYTDANARFLIRFDATNNLDFLAADSSGATLLTATTGTAFTDNNWHHVMYSFDLSNSADRYIYIDGALDTTTWTFYNNGNINLQTIATPRWSLGGDYSGTELLSASLADFWFDDGVYIDLSQAANRALFYNSGPVPLGQYGATVTGSPPPVFFSGPASVWTGASNNLGYGGAFTVRGTPLDGSNVAATGNYTGSLVGLWKLDDGSGTSAADSSGNNDAGTLHGSPLPTWAAGKYGDALQFSNANQHVTVPDSPLLDLSGAWTISAWVNLGSLPSSGQAYSIAIKRGYTHGTNYGIYVNNYNFLNDYNGTGPNWVVYFTDTSGGGNYAYYNTTIDTGTWYLVTGVWDPSTSNLYLYLNGVLVNVRNQVGLVPFPDSSAGYPFYIADDPGAGAAIPAGTVDDVRVYNRALTAADVWALYNNTACATPSGSAGDIRYDGDHNVMIDCDGKSWDAMGPQISGAGGAGCSAPGGTKGDLRYNGDQGFYQYCDGTHWIATGPSVPILYVADAGNKRVEKLTGAGDFLLSFGSAGTGPGQFESPSGVAVDSSGNVWVTDYNNNTVQKFTSAGTYVSGFGCCTGGGGDGNGEFDEADGIAIDSSGNLWVTDKDNYRIEKLSPAGVWLQTIGGDKGDGTHTCTQCSSTTSCACYAGTGNGQFNFPQGNVGIDSEGNIWVNDAGNARIQEFSPDGTWLKNLPIVNSYQYGLAIDAAGDIWCSNYSHPYTISKFISGGADTGVQLDPGNSSLGEGSANGLDDGVVGLAVDSFGNIWEADPGNNRLQVFGPGGAWLGSIGGPPPHSCEANPSASSPSCAAGSGNGQFNDPSAIAVAPNK